MSKIEWTNETWNPLIGCSKVSPGCKNCYAIQTAWIRMHNPKMAERYAGVVEKTASGALNWTGKVNEVQQVLEKPLRSKKPTMYFVNSMSDLFHENVPFEYIDKVFAVMGRCQHHIFQVLTKRPARMLEYYNSDPYQRILNESYRLNLPKNHPIGSGIDNPTKPNWGWSHVWLGVSVENQATANERIPLLLQVPAAVRFLSCEPLLGPVDLSYWIGPIHIDSLASECGFFEKSEVNGGYGCNHPEQEEKENGCGKCYDFSCPIAARLEPSEPLDKPIYKAFGMAGDEYDYLMRNDKKIHWCIVGGESGKGARPMHPDWARDLRDQCAKAGVKFFFKQWGAWAMCNFFASEPGQIWMWEDGMIHDQQPRQMICFGHQVIAMKKLGKEKAGRLLDGREWNEFPGQEKTTEPAEDPDLYCGGFD